MTNLRTAPLRDPAYLKACRDMPCIVTMKRATENESVVAAHLRLAQSGGVGSKPHDCHVFPLCSSEHQRQHSMPELRYWLEVMNADPSIAREILTLAAEGLYARWKARND